MIRSNTETQSPPRKAESQAKAETQARKISASACALASTVVLNLPVAQHLVDYYRISKLIDKRL